MKITKCQNTEQIKNVHEAGLMYNKKYTQVSIITP